MKYQKIKGTCDVLPPESASWQHLESIVHEMMRRYNYQEIRVPIFETTELFTRGIGEGTDIVNKEMYSFHDMGGRSLTLRPEATASVVRSYIEESVGKRSPICKWYYIGPMFRQEKPQKGRYRQFQQFGAEALGSNDPAIDAEMIALSAGILEQVGIKDFVIWINSVGNPESRARHREELLRFVKPIVDKFPAVDREKIDRNPLRLFDSKLDVTIDLMQDAPLLEKFLDIDSQNDFERVQQALNNLDINYKIDPRLVRGLDYYTKTAFEIKSSALGAQDALSGGGRYDLLVEELGGSPTPAIGFASGMERIILMMEQGEGSLFRETPLDLYIVAREENEREEATRLASRFRQKQISVDLDYLSRSQKAQMKEAARQKACFALILFSDDLKLKKYQLKDLSTSEQQSLSFDQIVRRIKPE